jgi:hypothetical protein
MTAAATVPVSIASEAAARLAELGMQAQLERMIEEAREVLPELLRIEVELNERYDMGGEPGVCAEAYGKESCSVTHASTLFWKLAERITTRFPPEVLEHLH